MLAMRAMLSKRKVRSDERFNEQLIRPRGAGARNYTTELVLIPWGIPERTLIGPLILSYEVARPPDFDNYVRFFLPSQSWGVDFSQKERKTPQ
jgi:hypothetical protein